MTKLFSAKSLLLFALVFLFIALSAGSGLTLPGGRPVDLVLKLTADKAKKIVNGGKAASYAPDRLIIKFRPGVSAAGRKAAARAAGLAAPAGKFGPGGDRSTRVYGLGPGVAVETAVKKLRADRRVELAEPDFIYSASFVPNDPSFNQQWGLNNTGQSIMGQAGTPDADIDAPEAWDLVSAETSRATVAVIDTGIDLGHPELNSKLWSNVDETADNNIDDDGNGFVDDVNGHNWAGINQTDGWFMESEIALGSDDPTYYPDVAQSFIGNGGYISRIYFLATKYGSPTAGLRVSIRSSLTGPDLSYTDLAPSSVVSQPYWNWVGASLSSPVSVDNGSTYYLVIHTNNRDINNYYGVSLTAYDNNGGTNIFPDGKLFWTSGGLWYDGVNDDLNFELVFDGAGGRGGRPKDGNGHGTHVGGIVAAAGNNSTGVVGVAGYPDGAARIMPLRVLDTEGYGWSSDIIEAVYYAADNGADVINMSLGGGGSSQAFQDAIDYAVNKGVVVLAAAGNNGNGTVNYPAGYSNVIGVGATNNLDQKAGFSNYNSTVDISAPGEDIYSTVPTYPHYESLAGGTDLNYEWLSGTSMATPMAAGLAALVRAVRPAMSPAKVQRFLQNGADDKGTPGRDDQFGYGRIDAYKTLQQVVETTPPTDPVITGSTPATDTWTNDNSVLVNFNGATDTGSGIEGYSILWSQDTTAEPSTATVNHPATGGPETTTSQPLSPDGSWYFNLSTKDFAGNWTSTVHYGPFKIDASAPAGSAAINGGAAYTKSTGVTLNLSAADIGPSGVSQMQFADDGGSWSGWEAYSTSKSWPLPAGDGTKKVWARFKDAAGNESAQVWDTIILDTARPVARMNAPTYSTGVSKTTTFKVTWSAADPWPSSGIAFYQVRYRLANSSTWYYFRTGTTATYGFFTGYPGRTYYFQVRAKDKAGNYSAWKADRTIVPYNEGANIKKRRGFGYTYANSRSGFYQGTVRYSRTGGEFITYRFTGKSVGLISTKNKYRSRARIYLDGRYIKTIDAYSTRTLMRQVLFSRTWRVAGTHTIGIVNVGNRARFDIDGLAVGR